ncbi:putative cobaltochelatase [Candidatus Bathyarchaeota archaeon A05DMB-2]|jgi:magnesium chelatase subunit D|nr:putative cobaltochelatase [Candidatus Bathyarchaeota archaeon A05DMB-2]
MRWRTKTVYPFSAIVGQEKMKLALILNVINPKIGGVLLRGEKGTGKSLVVRALAHLLPEVNVVADCPFHCDPARPKEMCDACSAKVANGEKLPVAKRPVSVVELPIGATEDRVVGTIDIEKAIKTGEKHFEPGLLAEANRNILYIDEVNLLDDHLVDVLLDAAAMGVNYVEREGVSFSHPAQFVLVGTMNPEEGELRPQLLDRFALSVEVKGIPYREARAEIVRRRIAFENNPTSFFAEYRSNQEQLRRKIVEASKLLSNVKLSDEMLDLITQICIDVGVDGHRADITMYKTACTIAAFKGRTEVIEEDVKEAAELALPHRRRRQPFEEPKLEQQQLQETIQKWNQNKNQPKPPPENDSSKKDNDDKNLEREEPETERVFEVGSPYPVKRITTPSLDQMPRSSRGRRSKSLSNSKTGRYVGSAIPKGQVEDLAFDATLRAAAPFQKQRKKEHGSANALLIETSDLREKVRERKVGNLIVFVVDASGSMAAEERMTATKGAILSLLLDAYQRRDRVGMVVFRKNTAELVLPPTNSVELAQKYLTKLPTGGRTPMAHGLKLGLDTIRHYMSGDKEAIPLLVLVSDGKANVPLNGGDPVEEAKTVAREISAAGIQSIAIDTERDFLTFGLVKQLCTEMAGKYLRLEELSAAPIASAVRGNLFYGSNAIADHA